VVDRLKSLGLVVSSIPADTDADAECGRDPLHDLVCEMPWSGDLDSDAWEGGCGGDDDDDDEDDEDDED
jgi:hypothetical protein